MADIQLRSQIAPPPETGGLSVGPDRGDWDIWLTGQFPESGLSVYPVRYIINQVTEALEEADPVSWGRAALVTAAIVAASWLPAQYGVWKQSVITLDNPPAAAEEYVPPPADQQVARNAAWRVTWPAQKVHGRLIESVDNPPRVRALPSVEPWRVTWASQSAPKFVHGEVVAAMPPPRPYPLALIAAWQGPQYSAVKVSVATLDGPVAEPDAVPRGRFQPDVEAWRVTWKAQWAPPVAHLIEPPAVVNDPPFKTQAAPAAIVAWQPPSYSVVRFSVATIDGDGTPPEVNDPPFRLQVVPAAVQSWQPPAFGVYKQSVVTLEGDGSPPADVDDPPPRSEWLTSVLAHHTPPRFSAYGSSVYIHVEVNDPPPTSRVPLPEIARWAVTWGAQRAHQGLAHLYVPPAVDDPPPKADYFPRTIWDQWQALEQNGAQTKPPQPQGGDWVAPPDADPVPPQTGGRAKRKRHYVEIDGEYFEVRNQKHAEEILANLREVAEADAKKSAPVKQKPSLVKAVSQVASPLAEALQARVAKANADIARLYEQAHAAYLEQQADDEDEDDIETMLTLGIL